MGFSWAVPLVKKDVASALSEAILERSLDRVLDDCLSGRSQTSGIHGPRVRRALLAILGGCSRTQEIEECWTSGNSIGLEVLRELGNERMHWRELLSVSRVLQGCGFLSLGQSWRQAALRECVCSGGILDWSYRKRRRQAWVESASRDGRCELGSPPPAELVWREDRALGLQTSLVSGFESGIGLPRNLAAIVGGKTVAIVGPAYPGFDNASEIDCFDVVARVAYCGQKSLAAGTGTRTDLSYYVDHKVAAFVDGKELWEDFFSVPAVILKNKINFEFANKNGSINQKLFVSESMAEAFFFTRPNALPQLIWDVVLGSPARIKVFNSDLFLTQTYPAGYGLKSSYRAGEESGSIASRNRNWCRSFGFQHDPAAQHAFYKRITNTGIVEYDRKLVKIVGMSPDSYIEELDMALGLRSWK